MMIPIISLDGSSDDMKKILSILLLCIVSNFAFLSSVKASEVEQLNKSFDVYNSTNSTIVDPWSMNFVESTTKLVNTRGLETYITSGKLVSFVSTLSKPAYIDSVKVNSNGAISNWQFQFYDSNKVLISSSNTATSSVTYSPPLKPVKYIAYYYKGASSTRFDYLIAAGGYIGSVPQVQNVQITPTGKDAKVSFDFPENADPTKPYYLKVYLDDKILYDAVTANTFTIKDLEPDTYYSLKLSVSNGDAVSPLSVYDFKTDTLPKPNDITNVTVEKSHNSATIKYTLPSENFDHLKLYKDNVVINSEIKSNSFVIDDLIPSMQYNYKIYAFSKDGMRSDGYDLSFKTDDKPDTPPPKAPKGLDVKPGNMALFVKWNANDEKDVIAYNIFLNGKKITSVKGTSYTLSDLKNDVSYSVSVQAVNSSSKTSELTTKTGTPYEKGMPSFKNGYKLKDVGVGVNSWFSSLWLIIAFAIGIPLAFYIAHRVKALFFT
ncbi:hypothetical protein ASP00_25170 [Salmonella enterica subsp. enterica serovar Dublin]|nr:hypothetical protein [Salmonella enterica subsp. enterica serovar Dublin]